MLTESVAQSAFEVGDAPEGRHRGKKRIEDRAGARVEHVDLVVALVRPVIVIEVRPIEGEVEPEWVVVWVARRRIAGPVNAPVLGSVG